VPHEVSLQINELTTDSVVHRAVGKC